MTASVLAETRETDVARSVLASPLHRLLIGALIIASLVPIWAVQYFPSQNGPWHLLTAKMLRDYANPAFDYAQYYEHSWHAIPHMAHTLSVYALSLVLPILVANKVAISLYVVLLPLSVFTLLSVVNPKQSALGYASFLLIYNGPVLRGYHDYAIGIPLVLFTFAYWFKHRHSLTTGQRLGIAALSVLVYFSHVFNFGMLGLLVVATTAWETRSVRAIITKSLVFVPGIALLAEYAWYTSQAQQWLVQSERVFLTPPRAVEAFFDAFFNTLSTTAYLLTVAALVGWSFLIALGIAGARRERKLGALSAQAAFLWPVILAVLTAMYFVTPYEFLGWHYVNVRFVPYVLVAALLCAAPLDSRRARQFTAVMAIVGFATFGILTRQFVRANDLIDEYVSGLSVVEMNKTLLPIAFSDEEVGTVSPLAHAHDYYHILRGGADGRGIARFNTVTPLVYRLYPIRRMFPLWQDEKDKSSLREVQRVYDYVLLWDDSGIAARHFMAAGFDLVHEEKRLRILRNRNRTGSAQAPLASALQPAAAVSK